MLHPRQILLNVGLAVGRTGHLNTISQTVSILESTGLTIEALRVVESDTEPTVVAQVLAPLGWTAAAAHNAIYGAAFVLGQQAIAAYGHLVAFGQNIGPEAAAWGAFDGRLFFNLDGTRLIPDVAPVWFGASRDQSEDRAQPYSLEQLAALGRRSVGDPAPAWLA